MAVEVLELQGALLEAVGPVPDLAPVTARELGHRCGLPRQRCAQGLFPCLELLVAHPRDGLCQVLHRVLYEAFDDVGSLAEPLHQHANLHDGRVRGHVAEDHVAQLALGAEGLEDGTVHDLAEHRQAHAVGDRRHPELVGHQGRGVRVPGDRVGDPHLQLPARVDDLLLAVMRSLLLVPCDAQRCLHGRGHLRSPLRANVPHEEDGEAGLGEDLSEELPVGN
mmetsp:Transcript_4030/g.10692  ORF Transcript_4030/g.10692 Transcript_4030/m.10692 type:complete len:222 (+) Transcript_4030:416-1081(+)